MIPGEGLPSVEKDDSCWAFMILRFHGGSPRTPFDFGVPKIGGGGVVKREAHGAHRKLIIFGSRDLAMLFSGSGVFFVFLQSSCLVIGSGTFINMRVITRRLLAHQPTTKVDNHRPFANPFVSPQRVLLLKSTEQINISSSDRCPFNQRGDNKAA